jgi:hypothetical protein
LKDRPVADFFCRPSADFQALLLTGYTRALATPDNADYTCGRQIPRSNHAQPFRGYAQMGDFLILYWVEFRPRLTKPAPDLPT